jgi:hypothetical protein
MRTTLECLSMANHCERMAFNCDTDNCKRALREAAAQWRNLARVAHLMQWETNPPPDKVTP